MSYRSWEPNAIGSVVPPFGGSAGGIVPVGGDHFAPTILVGNTVAGDPAVLNAAPFRYIPDTGNGAGIAQAFTEAAALGTGAWVHIRRGTYDFGAVGAPALPLAIDGFRVTGDGDSTQLRMSTLDRRLFTMTTNPAVFGRPPELCEIGIDWTVAAAGAVGTELIDASTSFRAILRNIDVNKSSGGPVLNANESLTSIYRTGILSRVYACRTQNVDGVAGNTVVCFRLAGSTAELQGCSVTGGNIGFYAAATVQGMFGCSANGSTIFANHQGFVIDATNVRVESCQASSGVDGIVVLTGGEAIVTGNNVTGSTTDGIRIDAGATDCVVVANKLNGNNLNILDASTESGHNKL